MSNAVRLLKEIEDTINELSYRKSVLEAYLEGLDVTVVDPVSGEQKPVTDKHNFDFSVFVYGVSRPSIAITKENKDKLVPIEDVNWDDVAKETVYPATETYYVEQPVNIEEYRNGVYPGWVTHIFVKRD